MGDHRRGKVYRVEIKVWHNLLMTGETKPKKLPMHQHPFSLLRIVRYDQQGNPLFKHPLWLIVVGKRRHDLTLEQTYRSPTPAASTWNTFSASANRS